MSWPCVPGDLRVSTSLPNLLREGGVRLDHLPLPPTQKYTISCHGRHGPKNKLRMISFKVSRKFKRAAMHGGGRTAAGRVSARPCGLHRKTADKADRTRKSSILGIQTAPPRPKTHREMRVGLHLRWDLERGGAVWTTNIGKFWVRGDQHSGCLQGGLCRQRDTATEAHTLKHGQGGRKTSREPKENCQQPGKPRETQRP
jgi:hypothetical protein